MCIGISYQRFSSKGKQELGDSLARQQSAAEQVCKANGWTLDSEAYIDKGRSGSRESG